jgi:hypothetical protein
MDATEVQRHRGAGGHEDEYRAPPPPSVPHSPASLQTRTHGRGGFKQRRRLGSRVRA